MQKNLSGKELFALEGLPSFELTLATPAIEQKVRNFCLDLPGIVETITSDKTYFKVGKRSFVVVETYCDVKGERYVCLVFKPSLLDHERLRTDPAYHPAPYLGGHGWLCRRIDDAAGFLEWETIEPLLKRSYRTIAGQIRNS